jgi:carboxypeptidase C (cathepsin A)
MKLMSWSGASAFYNQEFSQLVDAQNNPQGLTKTYKNLQLTIINKAGHLVPMDNMLGSRVMLDNYIQAVLNGSMKVEHDVQNVMA